MIGISAAPKAKAVKQTAQATALGGSGNAKQQRPAKGSAFAEVLKQADRAELSREGKPIGRARPQAQAKKTELRKDTGEPRPRKRAVEPNMPKAAPPGAEAAFIKETAVSVQNKSTAPQPVVRESISTSSANGRSSATLRGLPDSSGNRRAEARDRRAADGTPDTAPRLEPAQARKGRSPSASPHVEAKEASSEIGSRGEESRSERGARILVRDLRSQPVTAPNPSAEERPKPEAPKEASRESTPVGIPERDAGGRIRTSTIANVADPARPRMLSEEARERIVSDARIILRDHDEGEIRLVLKPESLGRVRVKLELRDHRVEGRFFVENSSVQEMFEQGLGDLARGFRESGFEIGSFEVSVDQRGQEKDATPLERPLGGTSAVGSRAGGDFEATVFDGNAVNILV